MYMLAQTKSRFFSLSIFFFSYNLTQILFPTKLVSPYNIAQNYYSKHWISLRFLQRKLHFSISPFLSLSLVSLALSCSLLLSLALSLALALKCWKRNLCIRKLALIIDAQLLSFSMSPFLHFSQLSLSQLCLALIGCSLNWSTCYNV